METQHYFTWQGRFTDHCPEIEIPNWSSVNQQKLACIYAFPLSGRWLSPEECSYKVKKQIRVSGMTAMTALSYVNEGPWQSFLKGNGRTSWLNGLRMKNWSTKCKIMNSPGIFPLLKKRKHIIFYFKISVVNTENSWSLWLWRIFQSGLLSRTELTVTVQAARKGWGIAQRTNCLQGWELSKLHQKRVF